MIKYIYSYIIYRLARNIRPGGKKKLGAGGLGCGAGPAVGFGAGWRTGLAAWVGGGIVPVEE